MASSHVFQRGGGGSSYEAAKKTNSVFDYDFFVCPSQDPKIKLTPAGGLGMALGVVTDEKRTRIRGLHRYLMSPEAQKLWIETQFPSHRASARGLQGVDVLRGGWLSSRRLLDGVHSRWFVPAGFVTRTGMDWRISSHRS